MSRTFKKTPGFTDQQRNSKTPKFFKRVANKKVRKVDTDFRIPNGKTYRYFHSYYDICDWKFLVFSENDIVNDRIPAYKYFIK